MASIREKRKVLETFRGEINPYAMQAMLESAGLKDIPISALKDVLPVIATSPTGQEMLGSGADFGAISRFVPEITKAEEFPKPTTNESAFQQYKQHQAFSEALHTNLSQNDVSFGEQGIINYLNAITSGSTPDLDQFIQNLQGHPNYVPPSGEQRRAEFGMPEQGYDYDLSDTDILTDEIDPTEYYDEDEDDDDDVADTDTGASPTRGRSRRRRKGTPTIDGEPDVDLTPQDHDAIGKRKAPKGLAYEYTPDEVKPLPESIYDEIPESDYEEREAPEDVHYDDEDGDYDEYLPEDDYFDGHNDAIDNVDGMPYFPDAEGKPDPGLGGRKDLMNRAKRAARDDKKDKDSAEQEKYDGLPDGMGAPAQVARKKPPLPSAYEDEARNEFTDYGLMAEKDAQDDVRDRLGKAADYNDPFLNNPTNRDFGLGGSKGNKEHDDEEGANVDPDEYYNDGTEDYVDNMFDEDDDDEDDEEDDEDEDDNESDDEDDEEDDADESGGGKKQSQGGEDKKRGIPKPPPGIGLTMKQLPKWVTCWGCKRMINHIYHDKILKAKLRHRMILCDKHILIHYKSMIPRTYGFAAALILFKPRILIAPTLTIVELLPNSDAILVPMSIRLRLKPVFIGYAHEIRKRARREDYKNTKGKKKKARDWAAKKKFNEAHGGKFKNQADEAAKFKQFQAQEKERKKGLSMSQRRKEQKAADRDYAQDFKRNRGISRKYTHDDQGKAFGGGGGNGLSGFTESGPARY